MGFDDVDDDVDDDDGDDDMKAIEAPVLPSSGR